MGLWAQFARQSPGYVAGLLFLAVYNYLQYLFDTELDHAVDEAFSAGVSHTWHLGLGLIGIALVSFFARILSRIAIFNGGRNAEYELRRALLHHLHKLGPAFYGNMATGDIMSRVTNDLAQVRLLLGFGVLNVFATAFAIVSALAITLERSVSLTMASLAMLPVLFLSMAYFAKRMFGRQRENQVALGQMSERVQSSISGIRVVRSFALEEEEARQFSVANQNYLDKALRLARLRGVMWPVMQAITSVGLVVLLWYGGYLVLTEPEFDAGAFVAFFRALSRLTWPLISLGFMVSVVQRGRASYSRVKEIFDKEPEIAEGTQCLPPGEHALEVRELTFGYKQELVLSGVSFSLEPGQSLAIVGRTGAGKSTVALLLARLYNTPRGAVFLGGVDICDLRISDLRAYIGYAQQDAFLFSTTIGRNIGYALDEPDSPAAQAQIRSAAEEAQIAEEIAELPDGYDTVVGERGVQLSGGQKQRVSLARALLSDPRILVLDDPLSAVDARTEAAILRAIDRQRARRSVVLITHRVSAAQRCDRIVVLDEGRIVAAGTHDELCARGGLYATFAEEQRIESELYKLAAQAQEVAQ